MRIGGNQEFGQINESHKCMDLTTSEWALQFLFLLFRAIAVFLSDIVVLPYIM